MADYYKIPDPATDPAEALLMAYKMCQGFEYDDESWDKYNKMVFLPAARDLLGLCGNFKNAKEFIENKAVELNKLGFSWSLKTVVRMAQQEKIKKGAGNDKQRRQRFRNALAQQRADHAAERERKIFTGGEILGTLGISEIIHPDNRSQERRRSEPDGEFGKAV